MHSRSYELCVTPGLEPRIVDLSSNMAQTLLESKKRINIHDLVLPWKPLYDLLEQELYPKQRKTGLTNIANNLMTLADTAQRFFPPHEAPNMLATFLPWLNGQNLDTVVSDVRGPSEYSLTLGLDRHTGLHGSFPANDSSYRMARRCLLSLGKLQLFSMGLEVARSHGSTI